MMIPYHPEPLLDFSNPENVAAFDAALASVSKQLGQTYPLVVGDKRIVTDTLFHSVNPSKRSETVGNISMADTNLADRAIKEAQRAFRKWSRVSVDIRASVLFKTAAIIRRRKHEFSSWMLLEAGKSRAEADADMAEAIDFLEYYGRQALDLENRGSQSLVPLLGEDNHMDYIPLGVGIIIPPWNFPLAIAVGMTSAAIVAGNTVVLKPASQTPVIAYKFFEALQEAGLPAGVVNFITGDPLVIGDFMTSHQLTRFISFTGSRNIGLHINGIAAKTAAGQIWMKRFIAEMGGKDAVIVDEDADLTLAAENIVKSAFGFSGQKCSACSRVIAHTAIYDELLDHCVTLTKKLRIGDVRDIANDTGPVIDEKSFKKNATYLEIGKEEGRLMCGGEAINNNGYFIQPTIFADLTANSRLMQEEIFGPVVGFARAKDFDEALDIANGTEFGLTGSVFTHNRDHIDRARREFHVGNLYFNRKCTGAIVGVHPFGGFNMSGTDSKAGGPDYLMLFTQAKICSEAL